MQGLYIYAVRLRFPIIPSLFMAGSRLFPSIFFLRKSNAKLPSIMQTSASKQARNVRFDAAF